MGAYIKALRSPSSVVEVHVGNGVTVKAGISRFVYKPTSMGYFRHSISKWERMAELQVAASDRRWKGAVLPPILIEVGKDKGAQVGDNIYACHAPSYCDTPGPDFVGRVTGVREVKEGRKKRIVIEAEIVHPEAIPVRYELATV
jgi:hypothetical protein